MKKTVVLLLSILMLALVSCGNDSVTDDNSQTENDFEFFSDYGWGYEFSDYEEETKSEPEYDYLIDIFEDVEDWLTFSGAGDGCKVYLDVPDDYSREINGLYIKKDWYANEVQFIYNNKLMGDFSFCFDKDYNLKAGDVVTIYASDIRDLNINLLQNGFYIKNAEYQFNYPDRGSYITSWKEAVEVESKLPFEARDCYLKNESIDINSEEAENIYACKEMYTVYGEIKADEVIKSESERVTVAAPILVEKSNGDYNFYVVYMQGIVIESEDESLKDVRVEYYYVNPWRLKVENYTSLSEAVLADATERYNAYEWNIVDP